MTTQDFISFCNNTTIYCTDVQDLADIIAIINNHGIAVHGKSRKDNKEQLQEYRTCLKEFPYLHIDYSQMYGTRYGDRNCVGAQQFIEWYYEN